MEMGDLVVVLVDGDGGFGVGLGKGTGWVMRARIGGWGNGMEHENMKRGGG